MFLVQMIVVLCVADKLFLAVRTFVCEEMGFGVVEQVLFRVEFQLANGTFDADLVVHFGRRVCRCVGRGYARRRWYVDVPLCCS